MPLVLTQNAYHRHSEQLRKCAHTSVPLAACYLFLVKPLISMVHTSSVLDTKYVFHIPVRLWFGKSVTPVDSELRPTGGRNVCQYRVKCPLVLSDCNRTCNVSPSFRETRRYHISCKYAHSADRQTEREIFRSQQMHLYAFGYRRAINCTTDHKIIFIYYMWSAASVRLYYPE